MTVLPTVRRQLQQAVERQANRPPARGRTRVALEAFAGAARGLVGVVGVAVGLGFAILLVVLLRHHATTTHSAAPGKVGRISPRQSGPQRLLKNDGIGDIHFGKTPRSVDLGLAQLFGRTNSDGSYLPGPHTSCGFDHYSAWFGLDSKPDGFRGGHRLFRAQLTVYFKRSRFVGYEYFDDQYISPGAPGDETGIPQNSAQARQVLHGPRITLATAKGLVPGDPLARARRLYGQAFVETVQANRRRDGLWEVGTGSERIYGGILNLNTTQSFYATSRQSIGSISGGKTPHASCP